MSLRLHQHDRNDDDVTEVPRRRKTDRGGRWGSIRWDVVFQVVAWIAAAVVTYSAFVERIAVVETKTSIVIEDVREIKNDIKTLLRERK